MIVSFILGKLSNPPFCKNVYFEFYYGTMTLWSVFGLMCFLIT